MRSNPKTSKPKKYLISSVCVYADREREKITTKGYEKENEYLNTSRVRRHSRGKSTLRRRKSTTLRRRNEWDREIALQLSYPSFGREEDGGKRKC